MLLLLPTDKNKLLLQWKGPFVVESIVGVNDYGIRVGDKVKTCHANMLKEYIERQTSETAEAKEKEDGQSALPGMSDDQIQGSSLLRVAAAAVIEQCETGQEGAVDDDIRSANEQ